MINFSNFPKSSNQMIYNCTCTASSSYLNFKKCWDFLNCSIFSYFMTSHNPCLLLNNTNEFWCVLSRYDEEFWSYLFLLQVMFLCAKVDQSGNFAQPAYVSDLYDGAVFSLRVDLPPGNYLVVPFTMSTNFLPRKKQPEACSFVQVRLKLKFYQIVFIIYCSHILWKKIRELYAGPLFFGYFRLFYECPGATFIILEFHYK